MQLPRSALLPRCTQQRSGTFSRPIDSLWHCMGWTGQTQRLHPGGHAGTQDAHAAPSRQACCSRAPHSAGPPASVDVVSHSSDQRGSQDAPNHPACAAGRAELFIRADCSFGAALLSTVPCMHAGLWLAAKPSLQASRRCCQQTQLMQQTWHTICLGLLHRAAVEAVRLEQSLSPAGA